MCNTTATLLKNNKVLIIGVAVTNKSGYLIDDFNTLYDIKNDMSILTH